MSGYENGRAGSVHTSWQQAAKIRATNKDEVLRDGKKEG